MNFLNKIFKVPSTAESKRFYADLVSGAAKRGLWGKEKRFNPLKLASSDNISRHFVANVIPYLTERDSVLDLGCGSGVFLIRLAKLCKEAVGADISKPLIGIAVGAIESLGLQNVSALEVSSGALRFDSAAFDKVLMVDVIHHLEDIGAVLKEVRRVLKPGGKLLIFEPNKLNPALFVMSVFDRNEWGLLSLGTKKSYEKALASHFKIEHFSFCGLLIGPDSRLAFAIANFLLRPPFSTVLRFFSPKVFIVTAAV